MLKDILKIAMRAGITFNKGVFILEDYYLPYDQFALELNKNKLIANDKVAVKDLFIRLAKESIAKKHEKKACPSCGKMFECKSGNITQCQCFDVPLNKFEQNYIKEKFDDCICASCLQKLKEQIHATN